MPRRAPCEDAAVLEVRRAALDASLQEGYARLRREQKAACARRSRELAARKRTLDRAIVILALYDSDRCWLPAFMREHGMSGKNEELSAFDHDLCSKFLSLRPEAINTIRAPRDQRDKRKLKEALAFITKHQLHAWVSKHNECRGIAPTVGDTLTHRDELAAAKLNESDETPIWSVATSARYKWAAKFRRKWRLGNRKPQAREAIPREVAREKADPIS